MKKLGKKKQQPFEPAQGPPLDLQQLTNAAEQAQQRGDLKGVEQIYHQILRQEPRHVVSLHKLGLLYGQRNLWDQAITFYQKALSLNPGLAPAYTDMGNAWFFKQDFMAAAGCYQKAIKLNPEDYVAHHQLGDIYKQQKQYELAISHYQESIRINPRLFQSYVNMGTCLRLIGALPEALGCYQHALQLQPDDARIHHNLSLAFREMSHFSAALEHIEIALRLDPSQYKTHFTLADIYFILGRTAEALTHYQRASQMAPDWAPGHKMPLMTLFAVPGLSEAEIFSHFQAWGQRYADPLMPASPNFTNPPDPERRLRIGYLSPDFFHHSAAVPLEALFQHHDRTQVEIWAYADLVRADEVTERFMRMADRWQVVAPLDDQALADLIRADGIDILVDTSGHTGRRMLACARKPAPLIVTGFAFGHTTGNKAIDYRFSDPYLFPVELMDYSSESVIHLPSLICWRPPDWEEPVLPPPCLANGYVTFGCGNSLFKINSQVIALWSRILDQVPSSRLLLKTREFDDPWVCQGLLQQFGEHGIEAGRLTLLGKTSHPEHFQFYHQVDISLNPFPYNGGISLCETAWMGVPTLSLLGGTRSGYSLSVHMGLTDWVAADAGEYLGLAVRQASDWEGLAKLRGNLRTRLLASPICDELGYTRTVEAAYRAIWRRWVKERI